MSNSKCDLINKIIFLNCRKSECEHICKNASVMLEERKGGDKRRRVRGVENESILFAELILNTFTEPNNLRPGYLIRENTISYSFSYLNYCLFKCNSIYYQLKWFQNQVILPFTVPFNHLFKFCSQSVEREFIEWDFEGESKYFDYRILIIYLLINIKNAKSC